MFNILEKISTEQETELREQVGGVYIRKALQIFHVRINTILKRVYVSLQQKVHRKFYWAGDSIGYCEWWLLSQLLMQTQVLVDFWIIL